MAPSLQPFSSDMRNHTASTAYNTTGHTLTGDVLRAVCYLSLLQAAQASKATTESSLLDAAPSTDTSLREALVKGNDSRANTANV